MVRKSTESDTVKLTVSIPRESYENMKAKAEFADISINKFLNRAGSIVTPEQVASPPWISESSVGVPPQK